MNGLEARLTGALGAAADGLAIPESRLDQVMARGARRRRLTGITAAATGLALASVLAATAWAVGGGAPAPPAGSVVPALTETTVPDVSVGTAPPTTSIGGEADPVPTTMVPDETIGTAPPTTSIGGESDPVPTTTVADATVGTAPPTTAAPTTTVAPPGDRRRR